ncbi:MAG: bacillithiol biosynthesis cysteine-adding enzyme BshC, partial [Flavobacterium sp.]
MPTDCISYHKSGYFSNLILDYLDEKPEVNAFYNRFPNIENFNPETGQITEKQKNFNPENRAILVSALENQYLNFQVSEKVKTNILLLSDAKTFTVTTGHQLNLFTGPLYFLYKIISTINLCSELKQAYPDYHFVPVYWMATEDHDFEEIDHFSFKNVKIKWDKESHGPVGRLSTEGLAEVFTVFSENLGLGQNADSLKNLFEEAYLKHVNLAGATRHLANELFGSKGLIILDGDDISLKKAFAPFVKNELLQQTSFHKVSETNALLEKNYDVQVNPREINLFYLEDHLRERILFENNRYKINNTDLIFSKQEIIDLVEKNPEKFSPNVILRPLYQEVVLPNLCYIGGGGELAYWLQLKSTFEANNISFPVLLLRNSALLCTQKQTEKAAR